MVMYLTVLLVPFRLHMMVPRIPSALTMQTMEFHGVQQKQLTMAIGETAIATNSLKKTFAVHFNIL